MAKITVDAEIFKDLAEAIRFVAERGGGIIYTSIAGSLYAKSIKLPKGVELKGMGEREKDGR